ncbi:MAG: hypothetical protein IPO98_13085 [Saprospiraceae bacterium]|jgi:hypothetical protein|nr:hypothetical protein [Saprospiraceae bacterium]
MITQDAFTSGKSLIGTILDKMVGISERQKVFFIEVTMLFLTIKGKINFTQMGRFSSSPEVRFCNMFKKVFDFLSFNSLFITEQCGDELIVGFDPSYLSKSGKHTPNLSYFYCGETGMIKRGKEFGCLDIMDFKQNRAYHIVAVETPPVKKGDAETGLINHHCKIFTQRISTNKKHSKILIIDSWFNRQKFVKHLTLL